MIERIDVGGRALSAVAAAVRRAGYRRRGRQFARADEHGYAIVHVQTWSRPDGVQVTLNLGFYSLVLVRFLAEPVPVRQPSVLHAHWRARIGNLVGDGCDRWWDATHPVAVGAMTETLISVGLPYLETLHDVRALRDDFVRADFVEGGPVHRAVYVAVLSAHLDERDRAAELFDRLGLEGYPAMLAPLVDRLAGILDRAPHPAPARVTARSVADVLRFAGEPDGQPDPDPGPPPRDAVRLARSLVGVGLEPPQIERRIFDPARPGGVPRPRWIVVGSARATEGAEPFTVLANLGAHGTGSRKTRLLETVTWSPSDPREPDGPTPSR